jgi:hypothetical protein
MEIRARNEQECRVADLFDFLSFTRAGYAVNYYDGIVVADWAEPDGTTNWCNGRGQRRFLRRTETAIVVARILGWEEGSVSYDEPNGATSPQHG